MSRRKRCRDIHDLSLLVSTLRGEVGELITTWTVMGHLMDESRRMRSGDSSKDIWNDTLGFNRWLTDKLKDEIISRLSELGSRRAGRTNFFTVTTELRRFEKESVAFTDFMKINGFFRRRNVKISHKEIPPNLKRHFDVYISYPRLLRGLAFALVLIKKMDRVVLGPASLYLWREARKKRYKPIYPAHLSYNLLPFLHLDGAARVKICFQELQEGLSTFEEISTTIDGEPHRIAAIKKWGVIFLGKGAYALPDYPLKELKGISIDRSEEPL